VIIQKLGIFVGRDDKTVALPKGGRTHRMQRLNFKGRRCMGSIEKGFLEKAEES